MLKILSSSLYTITIILYSLHNQITINNNYKLGKIGNLEPCCSFILEILSRKLDNTTDYSQK